MVDSVSNFYTYDDIQSISKNLKDHKLHDDIKIKINHLVNIMNIYSKRTRYKSTPHKTAREYTMHLICGYLNKITEKTYDSILNVLIVLLNDHNNEKDLLICGKHIFQIVTKDIFYVSLYSRLFYDLMQTFPLMENVLHEYFRHYSQSFKTIHQYKEGNHEDEYSYHKDKDTTRSLATFYISLLQYNIDGMQNSIIGIVDMLWEHVDVYIQMKDHMEVIDEIFYVLHILLVGLKKNTYNIEEYIPIIKKYIDSPKDRYISFSFKARFKLMDIYDSIKPE